MKRKSSIQEERLSRPHIAPSIHPPFSPSPSQARCLSFSLSYRHTHSLPPPFPSLSLSLSSSSSLFITSLLLCLLPLPHWAAKELIAACACAPVSSDCKERRALLHLITWDTFHLPAPTPIPLSPLHVMWVTREREGAVFTRCAAVQSNVPSVQRQGQGWQMAGGVAVHGRVQKGGVALFLYGG